MLFFRRKLECLQNSLSFLHYKRFFVCSMMRRNNKGSSVVALCGPNPFLGGGRDGYI